MSENPPQIRFLQDLLQAKEHEVQAFQQVIAKRVRTMKEIKDQQDDVQRLTVVVEAEIQAKRNDVSLLEARLLETDRLLEDRQSWTLYQREYQARHQYYREFAEKVGAEDTGELRTLLQRQDRPLLISPETLPACRERVQELLRIGASQGYLCIDCVSRGPEEQFRIEEIAPHVHRINEEARLLPLLRKRPVTVLSTWVLQKAWYDVLSDVTVWYDLCADPSILFGPDPEMSLEHWERLRTAKIVSYAELEHRVLTYFRKEDSQQLPAGGA